MGSRANGDGVVLRTSALRMNYGKFAALSGVDLAVRERTIHSVIGPNGAGKTTLFHCVTGTRVPTGGTVEFEGADVTRLPSHRRTGIGMSRSFQITSLFQALSVRENLRLAAQARHAWAALNFWRRAEALEAAQEAAESLLRRLGLRERAHVPAGELSHGQQRILEVGLAMAARPRMLFLDEPTSGMGVEDIPAITALIRELGQEHTILLIEHNMGIVMSISDRVTVMHQGKVLVEGTPDEVRDDRRVRTAYLGEVVDA
jgi:branched-chain amino acid transport system ATP-binding protein